MSALEIEMESVASGEVRCDRGVIVPPYEPAGGQPTIELTSEDVAFELDGGTDDGIEVILGEPIDSTNVVSERRDELGLVLRALSESIPSPAAGPGTLALSVATALMNLGCDVGEEDVRIMPMGLVRNLARPLPSDVAEAVADAAGQTIAAVIARSVAADAADLLHARFGKSIADAIGHDACCELSTMLARAVTTPFRQRCASRGDHVAALAWKPLHEALRLHLGFTLAGMHAERGLIAPFVEFIKNGHFPLGFLKDRTFLVITG